MDLNLNGMNRRELQALCKKHGIPANLASREMILRLSLRFKEDQKPLKKVKFSPENDQTFVFVDSDSDSDNFKRNTRSSLRLTRSRSQTTVTVDDPVPKPPRGISSRKASDEPLVGGGRTTRARARARTVDGLELANATAEEDAAKPGKRNAARARVTSEPTKRPRPRSGDLEGVIAPSGTTKTVDGLDRADATVEQDVSAKPGKRNAARARVTTKRPPPRSGDLEGAIASSGTTKNFDGLDRANATVEQDVGARKRDAPRARVITEPVSNKRPRPRRAKLKEHSLPTAEEVVPAPNSPAGDRDAVEDEFNALKTNEDSSDAKFEVNNESVDELFDDHNGGAEDAAFVSDDKPLCGDVAKNVASQTAEEEEPQENENVKVDEAKGKDLGKNVEGCVDDEHLEDPNYGECSDTVDVNEELKTESVIGKCVEAESADDGDKPDTQEEENLVESYLDLTGKSEPAQDNSIEEAEKFIEGADDIGPAVFHEPGKQMVEETISPEVSCQTSPRNQDDVAEQTSEKRCLDEKIEMGSISEKVAPRSPQNFSLEGLLEGSESETPIASNKSRSLDCEVRREVSQTGSLIKGTFFTVDVDPVLLEDKANVGNEMGTNAEDFSEMKKDDYEVAEVAMLSQTLEGLEVPQGEVDSSIGLEFNVSSPLSQEEKVGQTSEKMCLEDQEDSASEGGGPGLVDHLTLEKFLEGNESETPSAWIKTQSLDNDVPQTRDLLETSSSFGSDDLLLSEDRTNVEDEEEKMDDGLSNESYSETRKDDVEGLAVPQAEVDYRIGSEQIVLSPLGNEYGFQNFNEEKNDRSNEVSTVDEGASLQGNGSPEMVNLNFDVNSEDSLDQTNGPGKEHDVPTPMFLQELFGDNKDGKAIESDAVQEDGALNMDDDCFIPSPDTGVSELGVHSAEGTTSKFSASFGNGDEADIKKLHELLVHDNIVVMNAEENLMMNEDADQAFERQLSKHEQETEQFVSHDLVSEIGVAANEQDDVSAIIKEYMERETREDEFMKMNSYASLNEGRMINDVQDAMRGEGTLIEEDNVTTVAEPVLPKLIDTAQIDSAGYKACDFFENLVEATKITVITSDEPGFEKGGLAEKTEVFVITQGKPVEFEDSDTCEATENAEIMDVGFGNEGRMINDVEDAKTSDGTVIEEDSGIMVAEPVFPKLSDTAPSYSTGNELVDQELPGTPKQEVTGYKAFDFGNLIEATKNNDISSGDSAKFTKNVLDLEVDVASDEPGSQIGGSAEKVERLAPKQVQPVELDGSEMCEAMELNIGSTANMEIMDVISRRNEEMEEKCNMPIISQESTDCENNKYDEAVEVHKSLQTTESDGSKVRLNLAVKAPRFPAASEDDAQIRQVTFEIVQESDWQTSLDESANSTRSSNIDLPNIPATPTNLHKLHHMKENPPSSKVECFGSVTALRKSAIRRPLQDVRKH